MQDDNTQTEIVSDEPMGAQGPQPGMAGMPAPHVSNHLVLAILTTLCCCLPFGVVSIVYAVQVNNALAMGNYQLAFDNSKKARFWGLLGLGIGLAVQVAYFGAALVYGIFAGVAAQNGGY